MSVYVNQEAARMQEETPRGKYLYNVTTTFRAPDRTKPQVTTSLRADSFHEAKREGEMCNRAMCSYPVIQTKAKHVPECVDDEVEEETDDQFQQRMRADLTENNDDDRWGDSRGELYRG